jgi:hypothetical protein
VPGEVFALVGPDCKGGTEDMIRRADQLRPCVKRVRAPLRAGNSAMPLGGGRGSLKRRSMRPRRALGMTASQDLSGSWRYNIRSVAIGILGPRMLDPEKGIGQRD